MIAAKKTPRAGSNAKGTSLIEIVVTIGLILILFAISVPKFLSSLSNYRLNAAVQAAAWSIQSTRYQANMHGYPYQVAFDNTTNLYQVSNEPPPATSFANVSSAIPLSGSPVTLSAATTLLFKPNGSVSATTGSTSFSISYQGNSKTLTVSTYGSVSIH